MQAVPIEPLVIEVRCAKHTFWIFVAFEAALLRLRDVLLGLGLRPFRKFPIFLLFFRLRKVEELVPLELGEGLEQRHVEFVKSLHLRNRLQEGAAVEGLDFREGFVKFMRSLYAKLFEVVQVERWVLGEGVERRLGFFWAHAVHNFDQHAELRLVPFTAGAVRSLLCGQRVV